MIQEALSCGLAPRDLLFTGEDGEAWERAGFRVTRVPESLLETVCDTKTPQGVCATFSAPRPLAFDDMPDRLVALDGVQDPGNCGTIWRTADAAGFQAVLFGAGSADPLSSKVLRAAMGSAFRLPYHRSAPLSAALERLKASGWCICVSDLRGTPFREASFPEKTVLVIGNEARGISDAVRETASMLVKLPMRGGAESLNAAVAAGIMMYELTKGER